MHVDPIRVDVEPSLQQYVQLSQHALSRQLRWLKVAAIFCVICFAASPLIPVTGHPSITERYTNGLGLLILPFIVYVLFPLSVHVNAKKR